MDLATLKFSVETEELDDAIKKVGDLGTAVANSNNKIQNASRKVSTETEQNSKRVKKLAEEVESAGNKTVTVLERQKSIAQFLAGDFTKGEASILATGKAAGLTANEMKELEKVLKQISTLAGKNPFDDSLGPLRRLQGEYQKLVDKNKILRGETSLTAKQLEELTIIKARVEAASSKTGFNQVQTQDAINKATKEYIDLAEKVNKKQAEYSTELKRANAGADAQLGITRAVEQEQLRIKKASADTQSGITNAIKNEQARLAKAAADTKLAITRAVEQEQIRVAKSTADVQLGITRAVQKEQIRLAKEAQAEQTRITAEEQTKRNKISSMISSTATKLEVKKEGGSLTTANGLTKLKNLGASDSEINSYLKMRKELDALSSSADKTSGAFVGMQGAIRAVIPGFGAFTAIAIGASAFVGFLKMADELKNLEARIKVADGTSSNYKATLASLTQIANQNLVPIKETVDLYTKLSPSLSKLGATTEATLNVTSAFGTAIRVSGTDTAQASAAMLQFAQAMASGKLAGDEFKSIAENVPEVLRVLEDRLDKNNGQLRKMAEEGKLTSGVVAGALLRSMTELEIKARELPPTIGQAFTVLKNNVSTAASEFDKATGLTTFFSKAILDLANNVVPAFAAITNAVKTATSFLSENSNAINIVVAGYVAYKVATSSLVISLGVASASTLTFNNILLASAVGIEKVIVGIKALSLALVRNPLGLIVTGLSAIAVYAASDKISEYFGKLGSGANEAADRVDGLKKRYEELQKAKNKDGTEKTDKQKNKDAIQEEYEKNVQAVLKLREQGKLTEDQYKEQIRQTNVLRDDAIEKERKRIEQAEALEKASAAPVEQNKKQRSELEAILSKANDQLANLQSQLGTGEKLTESQKILLDLEQSKLTVKEKTVAQLEAEIKKRAEAIKQAEQELELFKNQQIALAAAQKEFLKNQAAQETSIKNIEEENEKIRQQIAEYGKTKEEIERVREASIQAKIQEIEYNLLNNKYTEQEVEFQEKKLSLLREQMKLRGDFAETAKRTDEIKKQEKAYEDFFRDLEKGLTDSIFRGFENGKGFITNFKDTIKNAFKTFAIKFAVEPFVKDVVGAVLGSVGIGSSKDKDGGFSFDKLKQTYKKFSGYLSADGFQQKIALGSFDLGTKLKELGGPLESFGQSLIDNRQTISEFGLYAGYAANALSAFKAFENGQYGTAIGTGIGALAFGPIGGQIGGFIGGLVDSAFGGGGSSKSGGQYSATYSSTGQLNAFLDTQNRVGSSAGDQNQLNSQFIEPAKAFAKTVGDTLSLIGVDFKQIYAGLSADFDPGGDAPTNSRVRLSIDGKKIYDTVVNLSRDQEQFKKEFAAEQTKALIAAIKASDIPVKYKSLFKDATVENIQSILELVQIVQGFDNSIKSLNNNLSVLANQTVETEVAFVNLFGGLNGFIQAYSTYQDLFYTDTEKIDIAKKKLKDAFSSIGIAAISTKEEFRKTVEGLDLSVESNRTLYAQLIQLAPAFDQIDSAIKQLNSTLAGYLKDLIGYRKSLDSQFGLLSPEQKYLESITNFNQLFAKAKAGDVEAFNLIKDASTTFLEASKEFNASSSAYFDDLNLVKTSLDTLIASGTNAVGLSTVQQFANGGVFTNSVITEPTMFSTAQMGEAGPEAIMPLSRDSNGVLGVKVVGGIQDNSVIVQQLQQSNRNQEALVRLQQAANQQIIAKLSAVEERLDGLETAARLEAVSN